MKRASFFTSFFISYLCPLLLLIGMLLRMIVFVQNRSLFIDESNLARNYATKSLRELWLPLDYEQYAPPIFNSIEYLFTSLFGMTEYALRLFPLISGIVVLVLFYRLGKKYISNNWLWFPFGLIALSPNFVRYATEVKQYSTDTALTLLIISLALLFPPERFQKKELIWWSVGGGICILLSMPAVFVLAGVGVYFLHALLKKGTKAFYWMLIPFSIWGITFILYFFLLLYEDAGTDYLQNYHQQFFFPLIPTSVDDLHYLKELLFSFFRTGMGPTAIAIGWGLVSFCIGVYLLYKKAFDHFLLLLTPIISCLVASYLTYYSLIPRLTLFFIPIILLFVGIGTAHLLNLAPRFLKPLLTIVLLVILFNKQALHYLSQPLQVDEIKPVMLYIKNHRSESESVFVDHKAVPAFTFYNEYYKFRDLLKVESAYMGKWKEDPLSQMASRTWFIFSFFSEEEKEYQLNTLKEKGRLVDQFSVEGSGCYLFEK